MLAGSDDLWPSVVLVQWMSEGLANQLRKEGRGRGGREGGREGGGEGGRKGVREGGRVSEREGGRVSEREGGRKIVGWGEKGEGEISYIHLLFKFSSFPECLIL